MNSAVNPLLSCVACEVAARTAARYLIVISVLKFIIINFKRNYNMSVGTFADRASRTHVKNIARQKKVVFGERPTEISASGLKFSDDLGRQGVNLLNVSDQNVQN